MQKAAQVADHQHFFKTASCYSRTCGPVLHSIKTSIGKHVTVALGNMSELHWETCRSCIGKHVAVALLTSDRIGHRPVNFQSVMERLDRVSLVMPSKTMRPNTQPEHPASHQPTCLRFYLTMLSELQPLIAVAAAAMMGSK